MDSTVNPTLAHRDDAEIDEVDLTPVRTYWQMVRRRFLQNRLAVVAFILLAVMIALAIIVPTVTGDAYQKTSLLNPNGSPTTTAPLGYDDIGENTFLRLMKALQTSLFIGFAAVSIIFVVGVSVGSIAGYFGGWIDNVLMRLVDVVLSLPSLFLIIMLVAFFGTGNAWVIIFAIGLFLTGMTAYRSLGSCAPHSCRCGRPTSFRRPGLSAPGDSASSRDICCPVRWRRSSSPAPSAWPTRSLRKPPSRSWASASHRLKRASAT